MTDGNSSTFTIKNGKDKITVEDLDNEFGLPAEKTNFIVLDFSSAKNLIDFESFENHKYINLNTGNLMDYTNISVSDYISVEPGKKYLLDFYSSFYGEDNFTNNLGIPGYYESSESGEKNFQRNNQTSKKRQRKRRR